jgi:hypothetical protein
VIGLVVFGMAVVTVIVAAVAGRVLDARRWEESLRAYRLRFPNGLSAEQVAEWLSGFAPRRRAWFVEGSPIALETTATRRGIEHRLYVPSARRDEVLAQLQAAIPGVRYDEIEPDGEWFTVTVAASARLSNNRRPLATERAEMASVAMLAALQPLMGHEALRIQWIVDGGRFPRPSWPKATLNSTSDTRLAAEDRRAERKKLRYRILRASCRIEAQAKDPARAQQLLRRVSAPLRVMDEADVSIRAGNARRPRALRRRSTPRLPLFKAMYLNAAEAAGIIGVPIGGRDLPGLRVGVARQLQVPYGVLSRGVVVAKSDHPGSSGREIRLDARDRLSHGWLIGPTGSGKSTVMARLALDDIAKGYGVVVIDPKRDLVESIAARIPKGRENDVVILDPVDVARPVGLNVLANSGSGVSRELAAEQALGVLRSLFADSWGPRTDDVLRSSLLTLSFAKTPNGASFTLVDVPELLTDSALRAHVLRQAAVPETLRGFWGWFEALSEPERYTVIGPGLNKLRAFTTRSPIRLMLGQSAGFDLASILDERRRVLLVPLSSGELGRPVAELLGALIVARLWQAIQARTSVDPRRRRPVYVFVDEFQNVLRLPVDFAEMLAQARGLGVGITVGHQFLAQLSPEIRAAVAGTVRTKIAFQLGQEDARAMAPTFAPLAAEDLQHLETHAVAIRALWEGHVVRPVTGVTLPLEADPESFDVRSLSRARDGVDRRTVEAELRARTTPKAPSARLGRRAAEPPETES